MEGLEAIAIRLEAIAIWLEAIAIRLEAIAIRVEAIAIRLEAIASRLELIHQGEWSGWVGTPWDVKHVSVGLTLDAILAQAWVRAFRFFAMPSTPPPSRGPGP